MTRWLVRAAWLVLPVAAGPAASSALRGWPGAPRTLAAVLAWAAWTVVLVSALAPRPAGLTALRVAGPAFFVLAVVAAPSVGAADAAGALVSTALAAALALSPEVAASYANGLAYGDEARFPLRTPAALALGPAPLAAAAVAAGFTAGPLLIADGRVVAGGVATALGVPLAARIVRSLHALSRRWAVLVPGGLVLHDPLTLLDPVLFPRDRVAGLWGLGPGEAVPPDAVDVRLGARRGTVVLDLREETPMAVVARNRRSSELVQARRVAFCASRPGALLAAAAVRRLPVR